MAIEDWGSDLDKTFLWIILEILKKVIDNNKPLETLLTLFNRFFRCPWALEEGGHTLHPYPHVFLRILWTWKLVHRYRQMSFIEESIEMFNLAIEI